MSVRNNDYFVLTGKKIDDQGFQWTVTFTIKFLPHRDHVTVSMRNDTQRRVYKAPIHADKILRMWPLDTWPQFARHLADNMSANSLENTTQDRLF